ncbi:ferredoxin reductase-like protein [Amniculicola lignicola CBS 123094]|uniref:Ferredoxin reductase-like protein n=1 Tax=Amniculicola lignicola CBS 123094 TaxID=1392246 RepID=A0A6A5X2B5_9PLEO|nr:ferredoxin reductase-like protein [Amniculicola lignicola CBS 123094]
MASQGESRLIPRPLTRFLTSHINDIDPGNAPSSIRRLSEIYGEIFRLDLAGRRLCGAISGRRLHGCPNCHPRHQTIQCSPDDNITITRTNKRFISPDIPTSIFDLLMSQDELGTPASQKQVQALAEITPEPDGARLLDLAADDTFGSTVLPKLFPFLDIIESNPSTQLHFATYIDMLKPLTPRQYNISSSPLASLEFVPQPDGTTEQKLTASVAYDVHEEAAWSIRCYARPTNVNFHLPQDLMTPVIMVAAGAGIAPMRGFIQERATVKAARNQELGPALLNFGCRHYKNDYLLALERKKWEAEGVVSLRPCFSKVSPPGSEKACRYVPERRWKEREELATLFGKTEKEADEWLDKVKEDRFVSDVFEQGRIHIPWKRCFDKVVAIFL